MSITITLSHEIESLAALRDEWVDLQSRSSATGMSLTWQWIYTWYKHFDHFGELWIITAHKDNRLIGIAPFMKVKVQPNWGFAWQQIEFIGASYDHEQLDFIIEPDYEEQVIPMFIDKLHEHNARWDVINLTGLCKTETPDILQKSNRDWIATPRKNMISPHLTLPDTMDKWMQSISRNHRQKLRRYRKKLDEQFPDRWSISQVTQPDELDDIFDHLVRLHQAHWETQGEPGIFSEKEEIDYFRELMHCLLENDWLRLYYLNIDNKPCAIYFCYQHRERKYYAIAGVSRDFTDIPLGYIVMHHSIDQAITEGLLEYSFMLGEQPYKYSFGAVNQVQQAFQLIDSPRVRLQIKTVDGLRVVKSHIREITSDQSTNKVDAG